MSRTTSGGTERRRGIVLLYTLSVLMIVMSLGYAYTQTSYYLASGLGSAGYSQMAYQAALSGQSYATSYIQQLVDARNHGTMFNCQTQNCGVGTNPLWGIEPWAGEERCAQNQGNLAQPFRSMCPNQPTGSKFGVAGGKAMPGIPSWFHYADVVVPDTTAPRFRLWFRLRLTESLTRNGYFYSDERDNRYPCGIIDSQAIASANFSGLGGLCDDVATYGCATPGFGCPGMMTGPFTPCGQLPSGAWMAPYPHSNKILYSIQSIGVVEAISQNSGAWAPVGWARVDTPFQILVGGYLRGGVGAGCTEFKSITYTYPGGSVVTRFIARIGPFERDQDGMRPIGTGVNFTQYKHAQPYIYFKELAMEVVRPNMDDARLYAKDGPVAPDATDPPTSWTIGPPY